MLGLVSNERLRVELYAGQDVVRARHGDIVSCNVPSKLATLMGRGLPVCLACVNPRIRGRTNRPASRKAAGSVTARILRGSRRCSAARCRTRRNALDEVRPRSRTPSDTSAHHRSQMGSNASCGRDTKDSGELEGGCGRSVGRRVRPRGQPVATEREPRISRQYLERRDIRTVLNVGASRGQFGQLLRAAGFDGRDSSALSRCRTFEALAGAAASDSMWEVHRLALGDVRSRRLMNVSSNATSSSFLEIEERDRRRVDGVLLRHSRRG